MKWYKFDNTDLLNDFINGIFELNKYPYNELNDNEKPFFFDYWLKVLNLSECYLLKNNNDNIAFVSYPKSKDIHYERWQINTLIVKENFNDLIKLPRDFNEEYFTIPSINFSENINFQIKNASLNVKQTGFAIKTNMIKNSHSLNDYTFEELTKVDIESAKFVIKEGRKNEDKFFNEYYVPIILNNIDNYFDKKTGWCFLVKNNKNNVIGIAYYTGWNLPLYGNTCALIDDIVVLPEYRKKGVASKLQNFAYQKLFEMNINWVCGNIEPDNAASIKQAKKLGRKPYYLNISVKKLN